MAQYAAEIYAISFDISEIVLPSKASSKTSFPRDVSVSSDMFVANSEAIVRMSSMLPCTPYNFLTVPDAYKLLCAE